MKKQTIVEQCFEDICHPDRVLREEIESDRQQEKMEQIWEEEEQIRAQEEEQIWNDMACDPKHWEQATMDLVDNNISLEPVWNYMINQVNKRYIFSVVAEYRNDPSLISDRFMTHLDEECIQDTIGKMLKKLLQKAIDEEVCK